MIRWEAKRAGLDDVDWAGTSTVLADGDVEGNYFVSIEFVITSFPRKRISEQLPATVQKLISSDASIPSML